MENHPRLSGILLLVIGVILSKFCVFDVLATAKSGAPTISLSLKGVVMSFFLTGYGGAMIVLGPILQNGKKLTALGWVLTILLLGLSFAGHGWVKSSLAGMGYQF